MTTTRLAVVDTGQANERILNKKEYRADFRRVEGASLKRKTALASPEAKRLFARCFYSLQASMYFVSHLGRTKLDHEVVERVEAEVRAALEAGAREINEAIDQAEALLRHHQIETLATYDVVPLVEEIGITSSFGRRYFELIHKLDVVMPMLETLAIEEIITDREHERRRSRFKRVVLGISTKARNFWYGVRRRMYEPETKAAPGTGKTTQDHPAADKARTDAPPAGAAVSPAAGETAAQRPESGGGSDDVWGDMGAPVTADPAADFAADPAVDPASDPAAVPVSRRGLPSAEAPSVSPADSAAAAAAA